MIKMEYPASRSAPSSKLGEKEGMDEFGAGLE